MDGAHLRPLAINRAIRKVIPPLKLENRAPGGVENRPHAINRTRRRTMHAEGHHITFPAQPDTSRGHQVIQQRWHTCSSEKNFYSEKNFAFPQESIHTGACYQLVEYAEDRDHARFCPYCRFDPKTAHRCSYHCAYARSTRQAKVYNASRTTCYHENCPTCGCPQRDQLSLRYAIRSSCHQLCARQ